LVLRLSTEFVLARLSRGLRFSWCINNTRCHRIL